MSLDFGFSCYHIDSRFNTLCVSIFPNRTSCMFIFIFILNHISLDKLAFAHFMYPNISKQVLSHHILCVFIWIRILSSRSWTPLMHWYVNWYSRMMSCVTCLILCNICVSLTYVTPGCCQCVLSWYNVDVPHSFQTIFIGWCPLNSSFVVLFSCTLRLLSCASMFRTGFLALCV